MIKTGHSKDNIAKELVALIRKNIGPVASFQHVIIVEKLPKTRSGKILRNILRHMIEGETYNYPATIEDDSVLPVIKDIIKAYGHGMGEKKHLEYRGDVDKLNDKGFQDEYEEFIDAEPVKKVKKDE